MCLCVLSFLEKLFSQTGQDQLMSTQWKLAKSRLLHIYKGWHHHNSIVFPTTTTTTILLFSPPPPAPLPQFYCFSHHYHHNSIVFTTSILLFHHPHNLLFSPPPPPPQFIAFTTTTATILLFHYHHTSIVFTTTTSTITTMLLWPILFFPPPPPQFCYFSHQHRNSVVFPTNFFNFLMMCFTNTYRSLKKRRANWFQIKIPLLLSFSPTFFYRKSGKHLYNRVMVLYKICWTPVLSSLGLHIL